MQEIKLEINKGDVYEEVAKSTAYIGSKTFDDSGKNRFEQVFVTDADRVMLERFWQGAISSLQPVFGGILREITASEEGILFVLKVTDNYPMVFEDSLKSSTIEYIENKILAEWCAVSAKGETEKYVNESGALLMQINNLIHKRCRPTRVF